MPLQPASPAHGLVTFVNQGGRLRRSTLPGNLEVRAGQVPFRTEAGLDVLPVDWRVLYKRTVPTPRPKLVEIYQQLYVTYGRPGVPPSFALYETTPLTPPGPLAAPGGVSLAEDTIDGSLWIALLKRPADRDRTLADVRAEIGGKTLSLGFLPSLADAARVLSPGVPFGRRTDALALLRFETPAGGSLLDADDRQPRYRALDARTSTDVFAEPGVVQVTLPGGKSAPVVGQPRTAGGGRRQLPAVARRYGPERAAGDLDPDPAGSHRPGGRAVRACACSGSA